MFVFYDIETSGIDIVFDQILQFGAILTDENLVEVDRFELTLGTPPDAAVQPFGSVSELL